MDETALMVRLQTDPAGHVEAHGTSAPVLVIHVGRPVEIGCERAGKTHFGRSVHGDIDVIPADTSSLWELKQQDTALIVRVGPELMREAALGHDLRASDAVVRNRFQVRDTVIEHLGWALRGEMESGYPSGELFREAMGRAIASRLLQAHGQISIANRTVRQEPLAGSRLRRVLAFIEDNLGGDLSLDAIATEAGLSTSHFQRAFGKAVGAPVHQYVLRRRVELARGLLSDKALPLSEVALQAGFTHQSHLAHHMRRALGVSPQELRKAMD